MEKSITKTRIGSNKIFILINFLSALAADVFSLYALISGGAKFLPLLFIILMVIADGLVFAAVFFINPRMKYALRLYIAFYAVELVLIALTGYFLSFSSSATLSIKALIIFAVCHLLIFASTFVTGILSKDKKNKIKVVPVLVSILISFGVAAFYSFNLLGNGFYGQGKGVTLSYTLKDGKYYVSSVSGKGDTVTVPSEFNGKMVGGIYIEAINKESIKTLDVSALSEDVSFIKENEDTILTNTSLVLLCSDASVDSIKASLYNLSLTDSSVLSLGNNMAVEGKNEDMVYITFYYDEDSIKMAGGSYINTWKQEKGTVFNASGLTGADYATHSDSLSDDDLYYCYTNNGYIMSALTDEDGNPIEGVAINESLNVKVSFEKVYQIEFLADNDTKYEIEESERCAYVNGSYSKYKYVSESNLDNLDSIISPRDGFDLAFKTDTGVLSSIKEYAVSNDLKELALTPEWTMKSPTITRLNIPEVITYGDILNITAEVEKVNDIFNLSYKWTKGSNTVTTESLQYPEALMTLNGDWNLTITSTADDSSIEAAVSYDFSLEVLKKKLEVTWKLPDATYDGSVKKFDISYTPSDLITGDSLTYSFDGTENAKNVGTYTINIVYTGDSADKYYSDSIIFEITKRDAKIVWDYTEVQYSGENEKPGVKEITGLVDTDLSLLTDLNNESKNLIKVNSSDYANVGDYTVTAGIDAFTNYNVSNYSLTYKITKCELTFNWSSTSATYKGKNIYPTLSSVYKNGKADTNLKSIFTTKDSTSGLYANFTFNTDPYDAGEYELYVKLSNEYAMNYTVADNGYCLYTIKPAEITLTWGSASSIYYEGDGVAPAVPSITNATSGILSADKNTVTLSDLFNAAKVSVPTLVSSSTSTSKYEVIVTFEGYDNYICTYQYNVKKVTLTVTVSSIKVKKGVLPVFSCSYDGFVGDDDISLLDTSKIVYTVKDADGVTYTDLSNLEAGTYTVTVSGIAKSTGYTYSYVAGTLIVEE